MDRDQSTGAPHPRPGNRPCLGRAAAPGSCAGANATAWIPLLARLEGYRLLAVDLPGFGLSDGLGYRRANLRRFAVSFLDQVIDRLALDTVPLVASSMGGLWSLWLALDRPPPVESIALLGCPALEMGTSAPFGLRLLSVPGLNRLLMSLDAATTADVDDSLAWAECAQAERGAGPVE